MHQQVEEPKESTESKYKHIKVAIIPWEVKMLTEIEKYRPIWKSIVFLRNPYSDNQLVQGQYETEAKEEKLNGDEEI